MKRFNNYNPTLFGEEPTLLNDEFWFEGSIGEGLDPEDARPHVLLIANESGVAQRIRIGLSDICDITTKYSIELALDVLEFIDFDIIITSLEWPAYIHKLAISEAVRALTGMSDAPILAVGPVVTETSEKKCEELKVDGYFSEPVDPWSIRSKVKDILKINE